MESLRIRIPQRYQAGIAKLIALPDESIDKLLAVLDDIPSSFNLDKLKSHISARITSISITDLEEIIDTLASLHILKLDRELPLDDFLEQLGQAMDASGNEQLKIRGANYHRFKESFTKLLSGKLLAIATKAKSTMLEHDHIFGRMRVITDIRSVFENAGEPPTAAVIVHMLKVHYIQDQQHKDFFLALDTADIAVLIDVLKQAQERAEALKSALTLAKIPYIDAE